MPCLQVLGSTFLRGACTARSCLQLSRETQACLSGVSKSLSACQHAKAHRSKVDGQHGVCTAITSSQQLLVQRGTPVCT